MSVQSRAESPDVLRILLVEDDPVDAAWLVELLERSSPVPQIVRSGTLLKAFAVLHRHPLDAVLVSMRPNGPTPLVQGCCELVRRAGRRPVVALIDAAERSAAADILATRVTFVYRKHPIMRAAYIRKQELRARLEAEAADRIPSLRVGYSAGRRDTSPSDHWTVTSASSPSCLSRILPPLDVPSGKTGPDRYCRR